MATLILFVLAFWLGCAWRALFARGGKGRRTRHAHSTPAGRELQSPVRGQRKPAWVARELIRIKAWSPELGCRVITDVFNREFACSRRMSVGKTYVANVLRDQRLEIVRLRRTLKHRVPPSMPTHRIWALDLTGKAELSGRQRIILGLIDHGSRAALRIVALADKSSLSILRELIAAFRRFGLPRVLRVDNEACLTSRTLRAALVLLGIRLQTIEPCCPWQNGRIERLFGTLKAKLDRVVIAGRDDLAAKLIEFRAWYNHARPHQHLGGRTPAEAWDGRTKATGTPLRFRAWEGRLTGWYFPP